MLGKEAYPPEGMTPPWPPGLGVCWPHAEMAPLKSSAAKPIEVDAMEVKLLLTGTLLAPYAL